MATRNEGGKVNGASQCKGDLWEVEAYLSSPDSIYLMEQACAEQKPAVEILAWDLLVRFGEMVEEPRTKQAIGRMVRNILEGRGYAIARQDCRVNSSGNIFSRATCYARSEGISNFTQRRR